MRSNKRLYQNPPLHIGYAYTKMRVRERRIISKIKPNIRVFYIMIVKDDNPLYYSVIKDGIRYKWEALRTDPNIDPSPAFTIWQEGKEWIIEGNDIEDLDIDMILQVIESVKSRVW